MNNVISRFISRLHLPEGYSCNILNFQKLNPLVGDHLELYHSSRYHTKEILKEGFKIDNWSYPNKGRGVYLANHSRYAWIWGGDEVIVCHISLDSLDSSISRFRSEIDSGNPEINSEYVIKDASKVIPAYLIKFKVIGDRKDNFGFVEHGFFGCQECDPKKARCDCKQFPSIDQRDIFVRY